MKNLLKILIVAGMIVVGLNILMFAAYFYIGSLEEFPTEERQQGIRWLCGVIIFFSLIGEVVLWSILRSLRK